MTSQGQGRASDLAPTRRDPAARVRRRCRNPDGSDGRGPATSPMGRWCRISDGSGRARLGNKDPGDKDPGDKDPGDKDRA